MEELKYRYFAEWFDPSIKVKREFLLTVFPSDGTVEMFDRQSKRLFLKRIRCDSVDISDIYVGSVVNVFSRQLFIADFADHKTREKFTKATEVTVAIVKDSGFQYLGKILDVIQQNDITINKGRMMRGDGSYLTRCSFAADLTPKIAVFELRGENAVELWKGILGVENSRRPLRAQLGSLSTHCIVPSSDGKELDVFFPSTKDLHCNTAVLQNSTCCIIKPHAVREGYFGKIMQDIIDNGFQITALEYVNFDLPTASEFYEVYKGVVSFYQEMVSQLISGPCIALEVFDESGSDIVRAFRKFSGPTDAELAKKLSPETLRGKYGQDKVKNAVHCTDLPEDSRLEIEYLFRILPAA